MRLTEENYFSPEAQMEYMSASQYKAFLECPAAAMAEIRGEYTRKETKALTLGSYMDALFFNNTAWMLEHDSELHNSRTGELKAEFRSAQAAALRVHEDKMFMQYVSGQPQVIRTGEIGGVPFKIKMDSYHPGKAIVDLKYMRDFESSYSPTEEKRINFAYSWGYDIQGAIYQAIEGNNLPFFIAGITKQEPPDFEVFNINQQRLDQQLHNIKIRAPEYQQMKRGEIEATRCGKCAYCRATNKLTCVWDVEDYGG